MKVEVVKQIQTDRLGVLRKGTVVELPDKQALTYLEQGAVIRYETKVIMNRPFPDAGMSSSVSPADQVSPTTTSPKSKRGGKKKQQSDEQ